MIDILGGLAMRVLQFYAWTVGLGLVVLAVSCSPKARSTSFVTDGRGVRHGRRHPVEYRMKIVLLGSLLAAPPLFSR